MLQLSYYITFLALWIRISLGWLTLLSYLFVITFLTVWKLLLTCFNPFGCITKVSLFLDTYLTLFIGILGLLLILIIGPLLDPLCSSLDLCLEDALNELIFG
jgi:hypothetical protein